MTIKQFIEKAVEGGFVEGRGWKFSSANRYWVVWLNGNGDEETIPFELYLLNPNVWKAVGKVEGWGASMCFDPMSCCISHPTEWEYNMHRMIDALAEGKTIKEFLSTL